MASKRVFSYDSLVHAISGAAGGATAMVTFFPLDTLRSRLQVEECLEAKNTFVMIKDIAQEEGIQSLYRGMYPVVATLCCSNLIYFYTFHGLRSALVSTSLSSQTLRDLMVGAIAGVVNVLVTTPLWVANSRIKFQGVRLSGHEKKNSGKYPFYNGIIDALIKIYKYEGWKALWSSLVPSLILVINPTIQFTVYEGLKSEAAKMLATKELNALVVFLIGAISKSISTILTYPLQLVQSKLRYGSEEFRKMNLFKALIYILRIHGVKGLFKGLEAKLYQTVFTAALMFLCYEKISSFVFHLMHMSAKSA